MTKIEKLFANVMKHSMLLNPEAEIKALVSAVDAEAFARGKAEGFEKGKWEERNDPGDNDDFSMTANYYHQD